MSNPSKKIQTLSNSVAPAKGQGIRDIAAQKQFDSNFLKSAIDRTEKKFSSHSRDDLNNLYSTIVQ